MKLKTLFISMGLLLSIPGLASAQGTIAHGHHHHNHCCTDESHKPHSHKDWEAKIQEREQQLLSWVSQYTPEKKVEWTKALAERKNLYKQWMSPENAKKREQWKSEKMKNFKELHKQFKEGKISKEEFLTKLKSEKGMGYWKTYHDVKLAVEKKDQKQAQTLLNQLLSQYKQHNEKMKAMLSK